MALSRKYLNALGIEQDKVDEIISAHSDTVNGLKGKIDELNDKIESLEKDAEQHEAVQKELDELKEKVAADAKERESKDYDALLKEFNDYKAEQKNKEIRAQKESAYKDILKDANIPERHFAKIIKYSDIDGLEFDDKGELSNKSELLKSIKEEWGDHIEQTGTQGANVQNPPANGGGQGKMTKEEIMKIKDSSERQKAIAENHELFGF